MRKFFLIGMLCLMVNITFSQDQDSIKHYNLDEVVVSSTRTNTLLKNIPQKVEIIDEAVLNTLPANNLADLLKSSTNLDIIQYPGLSSSIGMRGFSPSAHSRSYTLLLLNGKPMGSTNLSCVDKDIVKCVEIIKGPYSTLYGSDAMGGVINIITKSPPSDDIGSVSITFGSFGNLKVNGNVTGTLSSKSNFQIGLTRNEQRLDYRIGNNNLLNLSEEDKLLLDKASFGDVMKNSTWQYNQVNGQYNFELNDKWETSTEAIYFISNDVALPGNYWGSYGQSKKDIDRLNFFETLTRKSDNNQFYFSPYYSKELVANYSNNSDTGFISLNSNIQEFGLKMHDNIILGNFNVLTGADIDVYDYTSERFKGKATPTNPYSPDHKTRKAAIFTQLSYNKKGLDLNAGLRYNYITYNIDKNDSLKGTGGQEAYNTLNPSLGIQYKFPFRLKLHGSFGTGFSVPDAFKVAGFYSVSEYFASWNYWWVKNYMGNPELKPESSKTVDLGFSYSLPNKLIFLDVTYFSTSHIDKIIETTQDSVLINPNEVVYNVTSYKNANNSSMNGVEIIASSNLGNLFSNKFKLELYGNITYMLNNTVDETLTSSAGADSIVIRDLLYARKCNANFGIYYDNLKGFTTRIHARYIGSRLEKDNFAKLRPEITADAYYAEGGYTAKDKILQHPEFLIIDYSVSYTLNKCRFGITLSNLFNENYTEKDGYNMPGRMVTANFNYSF